MKKLIFFIKLSLLSLHVTGRENINDVYPFQQVMSSYDVYDGFHDNNAI